MTREVMTRRRLLAGIGAGALLSPAARSSPLVIKSFVTYSTTSLMAGFQACRITA
ncbi:MAG TPA: hypothetical protein VES20_13590 [Bryobacteraceae bacterium]|nr:hypothetical protein [Bryobacteraceae bacterium]